MTGRVLDASGAPVPGQLTGLKVLCVENEPLALKSMQALLQRWGMMVDTAVSAEEVITRGGVWDVILADYQLDGELRTGIPGLCRCRRL